MQRCCCEARPKAPTFAAVNPLGNPLSNPLTKPLTKPLTDPPTDRQAKTLPSFNTPGFTEEQPARTTPKRA